MRGYYEVGPKPAKSETVGALKRVVKRTKKKVAVKKVGPVTYSGVRKGDKVICVNSAGCARQLEKRRVLTVTAKSTGRGRGEYLGVKGVQSGEAGWDVDRFEYAPRRK